MAAKNRRIFESTKKMFQKEVNTVDDTHEVLMSTEEQIEDIISNVSNSNVDLNLLRDELANRCYSGNIKIEMVELSLDFVGELFEKYDIVENDEFFYDKDITFNNWIDHWNENPMFSKKSLIECSVGSMLNIIARTKGNGNRTYTFTYYDKDEIAIYFYGRDICSKDETFLFRRRSAVGSKDEIAYTQYYIASQVASGRIGEDCIEESTKWYEKAAANGYEEAISIIAKGNSSLKYRKACQLLSAEDYAEKQKAIIMLEELAKNNDRDAISLLGEVYFYGEGCERNVEKGMENLIRASKLGSIMALSRIGAIYFEGQSVEQDKELGIKCLKKAADSGNPVCLTRYAVALLGQVGDVAEEEQEKIVNEATTMLLLASTMGDGDATELLGRILG